MTLFELQRAVLQGVARDAVAVSPVYSRGDVIDKVLDGGEPPETLPVYVDSPEINPDAQLPYDPIQDCRLDKFDAMEMLAKDIDDKVVKSSSDVAKEK